MEADAAAAEERKAAQAEAAANARPKRAPGRPRKLLGFAALQLQPVPKPQRACICFVEIDIEIGEWP